LHAALREVVGTHVKQAGSLVAPDRLRFDFTHFSGLSDPMLADIELLINRKVMEDLPVETEEMELERAIAAGAMALFGEKYADRVRVVRVGDFSAELCGGTHTARTGEIGLIKLIHERGIASGTRRVEAVTGEGSLFEFRADRDLVRALEEQLSVPKTQLVEEIERRLERVRQLQRELERERLSAVRRRLLDRAAEAPVVAGSRVLAARADGLGSQETRELADALRGKLHSGVVVLGRADGEKASLLVAVTDDLKKRIPAGDLVRTLAKVIGGGGGGRPDMAEAGGREPKRLDEALGMAAEEIARRLEASPST
jgi:alanyl-tRNA synthetase